MMKLNNKKINVLIPDGECDFIHQVLICLSQDKNIRVTILSQDKGNPIKFSRLKSKFYQIDKCGAKEWIAVVNEYVRDNEIDLIIPIGHEAIEKILKNRHLIENKEKLVYLTDTENYDYSLDKALFSSLLNHIKLPHPKTFILHPNVENGITHDLKFPLITKPAKGSGGNGIHKLNSDQEFKEWLNKKAKPVTYVLQEYIDGYDIDCSILSSEGEIIAFTIQKGVSYEKDNFKPPIVLKFCTDNEILRIVKVLIKSLKWSGVAHIDLRYDFNEKAFKIIELNGRFWASVEGSLKTNVNFPLVYCQSALGIYKKKYTYRPIIYYRLKGSVKKIIQKPWLIFNLSFIANQTSLLYCIKDPLPFFLKFYNRTVVKLKGS